MNILGKVRVFGRFNLSPRVKTFVVDVDGVLTDGGFYYDEAGKRYKRFGPDDADALKMLSKYLNIVFVSADARGFEISKRRIEDMGFELNLVATEDRLKWVGDNFALDSLAYMGDSFQDAKLLQTVALGICPAGGHKRAKSAASYVTKSQGGSRAVAEACGAIARFNRLPLRKVL